MKVFVSGSISIKSLPIIAIQKLDGIMKSNLTVILGDANGTDFLVQDYLYNHHYENVRVYYAGNSIRNNVGKWMTLNVPSMGLKGRKKFTLKDIKMAEDSDYGLMIWDGVSKGTKRNIDEMLSLKKHFYVVMNNLLLTDKDFFTESKEKLLQNELFAI